MVKSIIRYLFESFIKLIVLTIPKKPFNPKNINKILVFAYHGLGNFIMYTPALKQLREKYPEARIDLQVGNNTGCEEVLDGAGFFNHLYNVPYSEGYRFWIRRIIEIRKTRYDLTINEFHSHSWLLALTVAMSRAPYRVGHVTSPGWPHRLSRNGFVFNIPVSMREDEHEIERYLDLATASGAPRLNIEDAHTFIHMTEADRKFSDEYLTHHGMADRHLIIGIQPGSSATMSWKQWPAVHYQQLIKLILEGKDEARIILFGSEGESEQISELSQGYESRISVAAGKTSIKQVSALIQRCHILICNDSGLMHVAVAVGTPVVAIYGPTDINRTSPLGIKNRIVRLDLPCMPCFRLEGDAKVKSCLHHECLSRNSPEDVMRAVLDITRDIRSEGGMA